MKFKKSEIERVFDHYFGDTPIVLEDLTPEGVKKMMGTWAAKKLVASMRVKDTSSDFLAKAVNTTIETIDKMV
jgi:hypothetical protein